MSISYERHLEVKEGLLQKYLSMDNGKLFRQRRTFLLLLLETSQGLLSINDRKVSSQRRVFQKPPQKKSFQIKTPKNLGPPIYLLPIKDV